MRNTPDNERRTTGDEPDPRLDVFDQAAWDASFDLSDFDDRGVHVPDSVPSASAVFAEIQLSIKALAGTSSKCESFESDDENFLFGRPLCAPEVGRHRNRRSELCSVVVRAYQEIRCHRSVDYVVAEPEANLLFLHRCWELGAAASPFELNWILMNARKDHRMSLGSRSKPVVRDPKVFDTVSYAADIAMRELQNELHSNDQRGTPSVDQILCSPQLVRKFDVLASHITPGFRPFDYRWAILGLRKARRTKTRVEFPTDLRPSGLIEDVKREKLPTASGLYWVTSGSNSLFVGVANDLRHQVLSLVERLRRGDVPINLRSATVEKPALNIMESGIVSAERYRNRVLTDKGSHLNFRFFRRSHVAA